MPIYDYVCSNCRHRAEVLHGVHDEGARTCPECGGQMRKAISAPAIVFKGSGWAKVDRRTSRPTKSGTNEGTGDSGNAAATDAGGDGGKGGDGADGRTATKDTTTSGSATSSEGSGTGSSSGSGTKPKAPASGD